MAVQLKRPRGVPSVQQLACARCRTDVTEHIANGQDIECVFGCSARLCSLECFLEHKDQCHCSAKEVPLFSERWAGGNCPLTRAILQEGLDVTRPYDIKISPLMDFFSESGKMIWEDLDQTPVEAEHHAPDCKTMSRARGRPFLLEGQWIKGPPALRDERNVMGFNNLKGASGSASSPGKPNGPEECEAVQRIARKREGVHFGASLEELPLVHESYR